MHQRQTNLISINAARLVDQVDDAELGNIAEIQGAAWALGIAAMRAICSIERRIADGAIVTAVSWHICDGRIMPTGIGRRE